MNSFKMPIAHISPSLLNNNFYVGSHMLSYQLGYFPSGI